MRLPADVSIRPRLDPYTPTRDGQSGARLSSVSQARVPSSRLKRGLSDGSRLTPTGGDRATQPIQLRWAVQEVLAPHLPGLGASLLDLIEHLFGRHVPFEFGQVRAIALADANPFGDL